MSVKNSIPNFCSLFLGTLIQYASYISVFIVGAIGPLQQWRKKNFFPILGVTKLQVILNLNVKCLSVFLYILSLLWIYSFFKMYYICMLPFAPYCGLRVAEARPRVRIYKLPWMPKVPLKPLKQQTKSNDFPWRNVTSFFTSLICVPLAVKIPLCTPPPPKSWAAGMWSQLLISIMPRLRMWRAILPFPHLHVVVFN
jgi:hypothetical protein